MLPVCYFELDVTSYQRDLRAFSCSRAEVTYDSIEPRITPVHRKLLFRRQSVLDFEFCEFLRTLLCLRCCCTRSTDDDDSSGPGLENESSTPDLENQKDESGDQSEGCSGEGRESQKEKGKEAATPSCSEAKPEENESREAENRAVS